MRENALLSPRLSLFAPRSIRSCTGSPLSRSGLGYKSHFLSRRGFGCKSLSRRGNDETGAAQSIAVDPSRVTSFAAPLLLALRRLLG